MVTQNLILAYLVGTYIIVYYVLMIKYIDKLLTLFFYTLSLLRVLLGPFQQALCIGILYVRILHNSDMAISNVRRILTYK